MELRPDYETIIQEMKNPVSLTPRKVFEYTSFLAALYAEKHVEATEAQIERGNLEAAMMTDMDAKHSSSSAKQLAAASESGQKEIRLRAALKSLEELIRALKKMGAYLSEESRNQY